METNKDNSRAMSIDSLVKKINDNPDTLHQDYTPSVHELITYGFEAARAILPLLGSDKEIERFRAQRVLEGILQTHHGWKAGKGYPKNTNGVQLMQETWQANGNYQADAERSKRLEAIEKWKLWLHKYFTDGK